MQLISYPINSYFLGTFNNILLLRNMKSVKQTVFILFFGIISLTTSRAMNILREEHLNGPSPEIIESPFKKFLDGTSIHIPMDEETDEHATGDDNDQLPALADDEKTIPVFIMKTIKISIEFPNNPTNDTMDPPANNDSDSSLGSKDSTNNITDDPTVIYLRPQPRTLTVPSREFYECVSCNSDFRVRKYYDVCLQKLSLKNQEIIQSCCNVSFDNDFCSKASTGKINYKTICEDPEKALMVGHCFWGKIEDKETDDIKMYRECKRKILDHYCAVSSSSENVP